MQYISQIRKYGIIQISLVMAMNRLKDPPQWLKVTTTLEKPPTPTHMFPRTLYIFMSNEISSQLLSMNTYVTTDFPLVWRLVIQLQ